VPNTFRTPPAFITSLFSARRDRSSKLRRPTNRRSRTFPALHLQTSPPSDSTGAGSQSSPSLAARPAPVPIPSDHDPGSVGSLRGAELPSALVIAGLEHASAPCQRALLEVLQDRAIPPELSDGPSPVPGPGARLALPDTFICVYVCPFDPFERPRIHRNLVRLPLPLRL
jgi:hypothetical protein